jgi:hypothetical protein
MSTDWDAILLARYEQEVDRREAVAAELEAIEVEIWGDDQLLCAAVRRAHGKQVWQAVADYAEIVRAARKAERKTALAEMRIDQ